MNIETVDGDVVQALPRVELSFLGLDVTDDLQVFAALANRAEVAGWITPTFHSVLIESARAYPTGLPTPVPVAIPHADISHVVMPSSSPILTNKWNS